MTAAWVMPGTCVPTQMSQPSLRQVHGAVHRLHRRVREERLLVDRVDLPSGAGDRRGGVAVVARDRARLLGGAGELGDDVGRGELRVRHRRPTAALRRRGPASPPRCERRRRPRRRRAGRPGVTPRTAFAFASSTETSLPPKVGDCASTANFIPGSRVSMPNFALPLTLPAVSRRRCGFPIELELRGLLERDLLRHGQLRRGVDESAVAELAAARRVHDHAVLGAAGGRIDVPALRGRRDQHDARRRARAGAAERTSPGWRSTPPVIWMPMSGLT